MEPKLHSDFVDPTVTELLDQIIAGQQLEALTLIIKAVLLEFHDSQKEFSLFSFTPSQAAHDKEPDGCRMLLSQLDLNMKCSLQFKCQQHAPLTLMNSLFIVICCNETLAFRTFFFTMKKNLDKTVVCVQMAL